MNSSIAGICLNAVSTSRTGIRSTKLTKRSAANRTCVQSVCSSKIERYLSPADNSGNAEGCAALQRRALLTGLALSTNFGFDLLKLDNALAEEVLEKNPLPLDNGYMKFYGAATSASSYGGYGGTDSAFLSSFKYYYDIPQSWTTVKINKQDKGYNGVDSRFAVSTNPKETKRVYLVTFAGYSKLKADKEEILDDLSLADPLLQDALYAAEDFSYEEFAVDGQTYVDYDILGSPDHVLARVTAYGGRLYAFFVWGNDEDYEADEDTLRYIRTTFRTIVRDAAQVKADLEYYKRAT